MVGQRRVAALDGSCFRTPQTKNDRSDFPWDLGRINIRLETEIGGRVHAPRIFGTKA
jgi:hypothetical protein